MIEHLSEVEEKVRAKIKRDLPQFEAEKAYKILFRHYGGEIMKERDPETWTPKEIGLVIEVLSQEQETADTVCALARSAILHMDLWAAEQTAETWHFVHTGRISRSAMLRVRPLPFDGGRGSGKIISDHLDSEIGEEIS